jgi:hypothetical protein
MRFLSAFAVLIALFGAVTPAQAEAMPQCGQVLTADFTLMGDWGCGNDPALIVGANGVTIDLNGHRLSGTPAITMTDVDGTTIRNGAIHSDIIANNATNTRFVGTTIGHMSATYVWDGTTSVTFLDSRIDAWRLFCGARCRLLRSAFTMNQIHAGHLTIRGDQGRANSINYIGGTITEIVNTKLNPLRVGATERLTIRNSELDHFDLVAPGRLELLRNTFSGGLWVGVHQLGSGIIRGNRFEKMRFAGLFVDVKEPLRGPAVIERNTFAENTEDGLRINVPVPLDITVRKNVSENNGQYGMWASPGTVKDGGKNVSNNDALGCFTIVCA